MWLILCLQLSLECSQQSSVDLYQKYWVHSISCHHASLSETKVDQLFVIFTPAESLCTTLLQRGLAG